MPRQIPHFSVLVAAALLPLAAGCSDRGDRQTAGSATESAAAGSTTTAATGATTAATTPAGTTGEKLHATAVPATIPSYTDAERAYHRGSYEEAAGMFQAYSEGNPDNAWGHYMLGLSAWKSGDDSLALEAFDAALRLVPTHRKSLFNSARVLLETGRAQEALERVQQALAAEPLSGEGLRLLGRTKYELGRPDEAVDAYQRALALDDRDVWAMNNLGYIYIQSGRSTDALPPLARAVEIRGNVPVFQNNFGTALERSGHFTSATQAYQAALEADSTYAKAAVGLERVKAHGTESDTSSVDVAALSREFEQEVEQWRARGAVADSAGNAVPVSTTDSTRERGDSVTP
jgi:tetratricopeptide (TPR) repeat protein